MLSSDLRLLEAIFFATSDPIGVLEITPYFLHLEQVAIEKLIVDLQKNYDGHGIELLKIGNGYAFRTCFDLKDQLNIQSTVPKKLPRAAGETLAIIAYHQPITRSEIEDIRGVSVSRGTLDLLLEAGWITPRGRRRVPGKPITWGTSSAFLQHFSLSSLSDLPGIDELKATGMLDTRLGSGLAMRQEELQETYLERQDFIQNEELDFVDVSENKDEWEDQIT